MAKRNLIESGVLVVLKSGSYWRNPATGASFAGPTGRPGSRKYRAGSGPFRIPAHIWARNELLSSRDRMFRQAYETGLEAESDE